MAGITTSGWRALATELNAIATGLEAVRGARAERFVGTAAFWGSFSEFGTSRQAARPWLRPAIRQTAAEFNSGSLLKRGRTGLVLRAPDVSVIEPMAKRAAELARQNVRNQGLVATGALERSVTVGKSPRDLVARSKAQARSPRV